MVVVRPMGAKISTVPVSKHNSVSFFRWSRFGLTPTSQEGRAAGGRLESETGIHTFLNLQA